MTVLPAGALSSVREIGCMKVFGAPSTRLQLLTLYGTLKKTPQEELGSSHSCSGVATAPRGGAIEFFYRIDSHPAFLFSDV